MKSYADDLLTSGISRSKRPYTLTAVVDNATEKVYIGANGGVAYFVDVHPDLQKILPNNSMTTWDVYNCSECDAFNKALWDGASWEDLVDYHSVQYSSELKKYIDVERCDNCAVTYPNNPTSEH